MTRLTLALAVLLLVAASVSRALADDAPIFSSGEPTLPTTELAAQPATITASAAQALLDDGAEVVTVTEDEAIARAKEQGVALPPSGKGFSHPWTIIKAGFGSQSAINLLGEIYINDNWTIEPHATVGLQYSALLVGARWHPDALCWGCKGKVGFTVSPGVEAGGLFPGMNYGHGVVVATSMDAELILRPKQHLLFTVGLRASGGALIETPSTSQIRNPGPPSDPGAGTFEDVHHPAQAHALLDGLLYVGVGW